jgi:hypothetical protein
MGEYMNISILAIIALLIVILIKNKIPSLKSEGLVINHGGSANSFSAIALSLLNSVLIFQLFSNYRQFVDGTRIIILFVVVMLLGFTLYFLRKIG